MFYTSTDSITDRAGFGGISGINVFNLDTDRLCFVGNKILKLSKRPAMQARANAPTGFDVIANVGQVLKPDFTGIVGNGFLNNRFGYFVVYVFYMGYFFAGDFLQQLLCRIRTVALKSLAVRQELVSFMAQFATTKHLSGAGCSDIIFTNINTHRAVSGTGCSVGYVNNQIEVPLAFSFKQFCFFGNTRVKQVSLMLTQYVIDCYAAIQREQGNNFFLERIGTLIKVHGRRLFKADNRPVFFFELGFISYQGLVRLGNISNGITDHLGAKSRHLFPDRIVAKMVQSYPIRAFDVCGKTNRNVTSVRKFNLQSVEFNALFDGWIKLDRHCFFHIGNYRLETAKDQEHSLPPRPKETGYHGAFR